MRAHMKKVLSTILAASMVLGMIPAAAAADLPGQGPDLRAEFTRSEVSMDVTAPDEWITVIVELEGEPTLDVEAFTDEYQVDSQAFAADADVADHRAKMVHEQDEVQAQIAELVPEAEFRYHYTNLINGFAAKIQYKDMEAVKALPGVLDVYMTQTYDCNYGWEEEEENFDSYEEYCEAYGITPLGDDYGFSLFSDSGSVDQMGLQAAWDQGYTGEGKVVAIFDSSLRYTHEHFQYMDPDIASRKPDNYKTKETLLAAINANASTINLFESGWQSWFHQRPSTETGFDAATQAKIRNGDFWYNEKVPFAVDYMDGDLEVWDGDSGSHGTHVAGITAGNPGPKNPDLPVSMSNVNGVLGGAYNAQIMFFKVFSEYDDFGQESDEAVFAALDDAVTLGVNAFNLSLGIPNGFSTMNTYAQAGYQKAYNRAAAAGISVAVSAGNDTRDTHTGSLLNGYTTILPNSSRVGFSGSLFGPMTVASAQGTGYSYNNYYYDTTMHVEISQPSGNSIESFNVLDTTELDMTGGVGSDTSMEHELEDMGLEDSNQNRADETSTGLADGTSFDSDNNNTDTSGSELLDGDNLGNENEENTILNEADTDLEESTSFDSNNNNTDTSGSELLDNDKLSDENDGNASVGETVVDEIPDITITDNNSRVLGDVLTGTYEIVDCGLGSVDEILAATGKTELEGALDGKVALVQRGTLTFIEKGENAYTAGAVALVMGNNATSNMALSASQIYAEIPTFGAFSSSVYSQLTTAMTAGTALVSFTSKEKERPTESTYGDTGPSSFTSWGVTEALRLKPDIMAPGGNILSTGAASDNAVSVKSGTSMASPNMAGAFLLVQQYVDDNLSAFGVTKGTQEYTNLVNQLVASTARVYTAGSTNKYFSPRRQGAGMVDVNSAINSKVVLHNDVRYDPVTGEAPRTKVELFDKLGSEFEFRFYIDNHNRAPRTFDVLACLQTDATTTSSTGENILVRSTSNGDDIAPIEGAVMMISAVNGSGARITKESSNINQYSESHESATVLVPANSSTEIVVSVTLDETTMSVYDDKFPNGMFLEGYVFFEGQGGTEDVNIPFMGFRGDWNQAPIFDLATAYDDISALSVTDAGYPMYYLTTMATLLTDGESAYEAILGDNQFTGASWPGYAYGTGYNSIRSYLDTHRTGGTFSGDFSAISPNNDSYADLAYANLMLLRNAKAMCVVIKDEDGNTVKTLGPEYEYFEAHSGDGNDTQTVASTYLTKYNRNMAWNGTNSSGKTVADGNYTYNVYAMTEYEFLKELGYNASKTNILNTLLTSDSVDIISMPVAVDTVFPSITANAVAADAESWTVKVQDDRALQAVAFYYDGVLVGSVNVVNTDPTAEKEFTCDLTGIENFDASKLEVQAVDYAFNHSKLKGTESADGIILPTSTTVMQNSSLTLTAGNELAGATYKWYKSTNSDGSNAIVVAGADSRKLNVDTSTAGTSYYYCIVTTSEGNELHSNIAAVIVEQAPTPTPTPTTTPRPSGGGSSGGGSGSSKPRPSATPTPSPSQSPAPTASPTPTPPVTSPAPSFTDTAEHWANTSIQKVVNAGIFTGTGNGTFSPDVTLNRAMFTTVLWRVGGTPVSAGDFAFTDVTGGSWYHDAVLWGANSGVVRGISDTIFAPDAPITREQMAVMLYRYAIFAGLEADTIQPLGAYADADSISAWAQEALAWAVEHGFLTGKPGNLLDPQGLATRAEAAVIIDRFLSYEN